MTELIIDRPGMQTARQHVLFGSMTVIFWALWIYLWLPILALIGWGVGVRITYYQMVLMNGFSALLHLLGYYLAIIAVMGGSLLVWAYYNYFRFRGMRRRSAVSIVMRPALSRRYQITPEVLDGWQDARRLTMQHDAAGKLMGVNLRPRSVPGTGA